MSHDDYESVLRAALDGDQNAICEHLDQLGVVDTSIVAHIRNFRQRSPAKLAEREARIGALVHIKKRRQQGAKKSDLLKEMPGMFPLPDYVIENLIGWSGYSTEREEAKKRFEAEGTLNLM